MTAKEYEQIILSLTIDSKKFSEAEATLYILQLKAKNEPIPSSRKLGMVFGWGYDKVQKYIKSVKNRSEFRSLFSLIDNELPKSIGQQIGQKSVSETQLPDTLQTRIRDYLSLSWSGQQLRSLTPNLARQAAEFYRSLVPFASKYPPEMLKEFFLYWTAPNASVTRMLFQMQRTWAVGSRLATWSKREKQTAQNYDQQQRIDKNRENAIKAMRNIATTAHSTISDVEDNF